MSDLISRQAAIEAIVNTPSEVQNKNIPLVNQYDGATFRQIEILGIIEALPSAHPERQRGEWIEISSINHTYKCSECGRLLVNITGGRNNVSKHYPYCHCGALDEAPTVEAIPVEWIENYAKENYPIWDRHAPIRAFYTNMIKVWRKENE